MKRVFAFALVLVMLLAVVPAMGTTAKAETTTTSTEPVTIRPFYGLTWDEVERSLFGNLENAPVMTVYNTDGVVTMSGSSDFAAYARSMKTKLDALPEGMRYIRIFKTTEALKAGAECVIYADNGMNQLKALMTEFIAEYHAIGGQLDGIILDTEYVAMASWYIYSDTYGGYYEPSADKIAEKGYNRNIFNDIVNHPQYETDIRPLLVERGFAFYDAVGGNKSEIWSMFPPQIWSSFSAAEKTKFNTYYTNCYSIWNTVMDNRITAYLTEAVYEPMAALYPNATVSDYKVTDSATWENYMSESGGVYNYVGNTYKVGNTSNENMYNSNPNSSFFKDGDTYLYKNIQSYNKAVYDDDAFGSLMFNVNRFKGMYAATDTKKVSVWIAEYDYSGRSNSVKNSPYYTEFLYHAGLLDPLPFLVYMYRGASNFKGDEGLAVYNQRMKVISQALNELTRVAGYSDRKPIETPQAWNDGFMLSGMYANGRNIWRLTPDTTDGMSLLRFKVSGTTDPTFSINGNTVTFPGGKILTDAAIDDVGSCGYWIETSKDVQPVITREADHYANNPSLLETFDALIAGTMVNSPNTKPMQTWSLGLPMGTSSSNSISMSGTTTTQKTLALPSALISATDDYSKKHQVWDVQVSLPSGLIADAELVLMTCGSDGGFKIQNKKVYYDNNGSYVEMPGVTLALGSTYRLRRSVDFSVNGAYTCDYSVYDGAGNLLGTVSDVPMKSVSLPVQQLGFSYKNVKKIKSSTTDSAGNVTYTYTNVTATVKNGTAGVPLYVESYNESNALALTGTATLNNLKLPKNITAGDVYAKHQAWEISFTLAGALTTGSATLFNGLVKLEGGKAHYNSNGSYVALAEIAAGTKYTIHINNNFEASTATYTLSADGAVVAQAENVKVPAVTTPVDTISMTSTSLTTKVYLDDYKLYPTGREYSIKFYNAENGLLQSATEKLTNNKVAFRIGWMNATNTDAKGQIHVARYDKNGALVSDTILRTFDMKASFEGAETGVLENTTGSLSVYLHICDKDNTELVGFVQGSCTVSGYTGDLICKDCGEIYEKGVADNASGHKKKTITGKAATCTTDGLTRGEECTLCGQILVEQQVIPAAHKETIIAGKEATCTTAGKTEGVRCSQCATVIVAQEVIPAGHKEEILPGKEATCEADGLTEGKNCAACGEILVAQQVIPALGHTPGEAVKENIVGESCTAAGSYDLVHYCTVCDVEASRETITVEALGHTNEITTETKDATCTEAGYIKTTAICKVCGEQTETIEEIAALGHTEVTATETKDATCSEAGYIKNIVTCSVCNKTLSETTEPIAALGHAYDNNFDATCNNCGEERVVADGLTVTAENMLQLVDSDENHIYHRVTVYFMGDQTVADITDEAALKAIDPKAKTYWGKEEINKVVLKNAGKYVLVLNYNNGAGGKKETVCVEANVVACELILPTVDVQNNKIAVTAGDASIANYRAVIYYLGNRTLTNINNEILLKAMDPNAQTTWGLNAINKIQLWKSGNYVIQLQYNIGNGAKQTITKAFTVAFSELTVDVVGGRLVVADPDNAYLHHRAVVYYVGDELVNPDDLNEVKAAATTSTTYWGLESINKAKLIKSGNYVVVLEYNLSNSPKMTKAISVTF